jgi:hypothetical protein
MGDRKSIVLRLDPKKLKALEKWAVDEFRSTNGQIEYIIDEALRKAGRYKGKREVWMKRKNLNLSPNPPRGGINSFQYFNKSHLEPVCRQAGI